MTKLLAGGLFLLLAGPLVSGSLFGPFGPFGAPGAQLPGAGVPGYGGGVGGFPGAAGLPFYPGGFGQLPFYPPVYPANPYLPVGLPAAPAFPGPLRTLPSPAALPATVPPTATGNLRVVATNADVLGRLAVADLPEDLQQRAQDLQAASDQGFDACEQLLTTSGSYWQYKRCNAFQLRNVLTAAKALEQEATARTTTVGAVGAATEPAQVAA